MTDTGGSNARPADKPRAIRVLFLPDFGYGNPYQAELRKALEARGISVSGARAPGRDPIAIVRAWLAHGRPNVVHLHWTHNYLGQRSDRPQPRFPRVRSTLFLGQLKILRTLGVRVIWTVHNLGHHEEPALAGENAWVHRRLVRLSAAVICHCEAAVEAVTTTYGLNRREIAKLHVIPHGSYVDVYGPAVERGAARASLGIDDTVRVLVFVGAVRAYKGVADLVSAFAGLTATDARLIIAGKPSAGDDMSALTAAAAADPRIDLRLRYLPDADMPVLLGAADAVALPFRDILTSGSAILAMSYGRAVVAPSLGCIPQTLDHEGSVLYDAADAQGLPKALQAALNSDLDAMGRHNLTVARRFAWGPIAAATAELYEQLAQTRT